MKTAIIIFLLLLSVVISKAATFANYFTTNANPTNIVGNFYGDGAGLTNVPGSTGSVTNNQYLPGIPSSTNGFFGGLFTGSFSNTLSIVRGHGTSVTNTWSIENSGEGLTLSWQQIAPGGIVSRGFGDFVTTNGYFYFAGGVTNAGFLAVGGNLTFWDAFYPGLRLHSADAADLVNWDDLDTVETGALVYNTDLARPYVSLDGTGSNWKPLLYLDDVIAQLQRFTNSINASNIVTTNLTVTGTAYIDSLTATNVYYLKTNQYAMFDGNGKLVGTNNGWFWTNIPMSSLTEQTNLWYGGTTLSFTNASSYTNMAGNLTVAGLASFSTTNVNTFTLICNANGSDRTITIPAEWRASPYGGTAYTVTNGSVCDFTVRMQLGVFTNAYFNWSF